VLPTYLPYVKYSYLLVTLNTLSVSMVVVIIGINSARCMSNVALKVVRKSAWFSYYFQMWYGDLRRSPAENICQCFPSITECFLLGCFKPRVILCVGLCLLGLGREGVPGRPPSKSLNTHSYLTEFHDDKVYLGLLRVSFVDVLFVSYSGPSLSSFAS